MNVGDYIKQLRISHGMTQEELGAKIGVKRAAVQKWECGTTQNLKRVTIQKLGEIFGVSPSTFINDEVSAEKHLVPPAVTGDFVTFPVIGEIAAGYDSIAIEDWSGDTVKIHTDYLKGRDIDDFFVLSVKGNSMFPEYQDGDKVLVLKQSTLNYSGQVGAILYNNDTATLKKVEYKDGEDWLKLVPINPTFPAERIEGAELERCRVLGIPRLLIRDIKQ